MYHPLSRPVKTLGALHMVIRRSNITPEESTKPPGKKWPQGVYKCNVLRPYLAVVLYLRSPRSHILQFAVTSIHKTIPLSHDIDRAEPDCPEASFARPGATSLISNHFVRRMFPVQALPQHLFMYQAIMKNEHH